MIRRAPDPARVQEEVVRAIGNFRGQFDSMRADYTAAKSGRNYKHPPRINKQGTGADYHIRNQADYFTLMELARNIANNDQVVSQGIRTLRRNIVQDGFRPKPNTGDKAADVELLERWNEWAGDERKCHHEREHDFHEMESMAVEAMIRDGDILASGLEDGTLQQYEGHRVRSPSKVIDKSRDVVLGVERMANGARGWFHVTRHEYDGVNVSRIQADDIQRISARMFDPLTNTDERICFQLYDPRRLSQTRGMTALAPILVTTAMHDDVQFAKLVQSQIVSYFAILHNRDPNYADVVPGSAGTSGTSGEPSACKGPDERQVTPTYYGAEYFAEPGEKLEAFSPDTPNPEFFNHSKMLLSFIAVTLDLPLILLLMDASETNFSGWRGAFEQAKIRFRDTQSSIIGRYHWPIYRWKATHFLRESRTLRAAFNRLGPAIFDHEWHPPRWPWIQPMEEVSATVLELHGNLCSPRRALLRQGLEWNVVIDETLEDRSYAIERANEYAAKINSRFPEAKCDWREVLAAQLPQGFQMSLGDRNNGQGQDASGK